MQITYITVASFPSTSAHTAYAVNLAAALQACGAAAVLIAHRGDARALPPPATPFELRLYGPSGFSSKSWLKPLAAIAYLLANRSAIPPGSALITHDVIVANFLAAAGRDFILDLHGLGPKGRLLKRLLNSRRCSALIFNGAPMKETIESRFGKTRLPSLILGSGIEAAHFHSAPPPAETRKKHGFGEGEIVIAYGGSMGEGRGIDLILKAGAALKANPRLRWMFIGGRADELTQWRRLAAGLGLGEPRLQFLGHRSQAELASLLTAADLLLAPYERELAAAPFMRPMKLVEYQAAGRPIIASDLPAVRAAIFPEAACDYFDPGDIRSLISALERALVALPERTRRAELARPLALAETWDAKARQLIAFAQKIPSQG